MQGENYLILLAGDAYDVPHRGADGEKDELSDEVFRFFVCTVCPVKDATAALRYFSEERAFHGTSTGQTVAAPALGFLFPAFDDRRANIYDALYYSHDTAEIHPELIDGLFRVAPPMSAAEQKGDVLRNARRGARYRLPVRRRAGRARKSAQPH